jgi:hypothetical protein
MALQDLIWLRLGIALFVFIVPGLAIYGLLTDGQGRWTDHLPFGFVISHLIIASGGTIGRLVHVSFDLIKDLMMPGAITSSLFIANSFQRNTVSNKSQR